MPHFAYTARDAQGATVSDSVEAGSRQDALRRLSARGLQPLRLTESTAAAVKRPKKSKSAAKTTSDSRPIQNPKSKIRNGKAKLTRAHRLPFLEALHDLTTSGLSAGEAVRLLSVRINEPALRTICSTLWERLSEGDPLSKAMAGMPEVFDEATLNLLEAGEATGNLNETLARLIDHHTAQRELRRQVVAAMAYPLFMTVVAGGVVLFFLFFLLPRLQSLLDALGGELPPATRLLVGLSDFALNYGLVVVAGLAFAAVTFWRWRASAAGRLVTDGWMLRLPLLGPFAVGQTVLAFSETLSVLLENGITTSEALRMTERQIQNRVHRAAFDEATDRVLEGETLSVALTRTQVFPALVLDQLAIGENTGNVVPALKKMASSYRRQLADTLNRFTRVFASAVLMGVFTFVGFIAYAIVTAVFQLSNSFQM